MQDAVSAAPLRQHPHESASCKGLVAVRGRQQRNSSASACGGYQNLETTARKAWLHRHTADISVFSRQLVAI